MRVEVLAIGDELLDGRVADTNTLRLADALSDIGLKISQRTTITDDKDVIIREAIAIASRGANLCIVSGGLGPTTDDVTSESFAQLLEVPLTRDEEQAAVITERLERFGREVTPNQLKQADRPQGAVVIPNAFGTAPGFEITYEGCRFISVPGVPREFDPMILKAVVEPLSKEYVPGLKISLRCFGLVEAQVDKRLAAIHEKWPQIRIGYRAHFPEIQVSLKAADEHQVQLHEAADFAREALGLSLFSEVDEPFAAPLVELLKKEKCTVALAESCTGGLMGDLLTDAPGSSDVFVQGVVAYSYECKEKSLGVARETLDAHGAVSEETVLEMAEGIRRVSGASIGISASGIAGPDGGTEEKPVGTVWLAVNADGYIKTKKLTLPFDRRRNKIISAHAGLDLIRRYLLSER